MINVLLNIKWYCFNIFVYFYFVLSFYCPFSFSQNIFFNKTFDFQGGSETGLSVLEISDKKYMTVSVGDDTTGYLRILITVWDQYGNVLNQKPLIATNNHYYPGEQGSAIKTKDGNYAVGGSMVVNDNNISDALLVKFDENGDTIWTETYGGDSFDVAYSCRQTNDGGYILCGTTKSFEDLWEGNVYLVKTDSNGKFEWHQNYGKGLLDAGDNAEQTPDGGYVVCGYTESNGGGIYLIKTDSLGNKEWEKIINVNIEGYGGHVMVCKDGHYLIYQAIDNSDGNGIQGYIAKIHYINKTIIWEKSYGGTEEDVFLKIIELSDGNFICAGGYRNDTYGWLMKLDAYGDSIWSRKHYTNSVIKNFYDVQKTQDNGYILTGVAVYGLSGTQDIWVVKTDSLGNTCSKPECDSIVSVDEIDTIVFTDTRFLFQLYPNPFTGKTNIEAYLPTGIEKGELVIYDVEGRMVHVISLTKGLNKITLPATSLYKGVYIYKLIGNGNVAAKGKMVVY